MMYVAAVRTRQWPLTAAATQLLLALPASDAKPRGMPPPKQTVKLGVKELIVRGAYRIYIEQGRRRSTKVTLIPQRRPALPPSLHSFDAALRPWTPAEIKEVIKKARKANSTLIEDLGELFQSELADRGLIAETRRKALGLFPTAKWARTPSGDSWAATGAQYLQRLESLPVEMESDPQSAARVAAIAGALTLMVPMAMASVARLRRRRSSRGGDLNMNFLYVAGDDFSGDAGEDPTGFDPFDAVGDLFDSVLEGGLDSLDAGIDAVDSALDALADSIDSAVDAGVDAGGGGDGGGGGNGGGGGGGNGGSS